MIQIIPCPACQRSTVLMEGVSLEATIQCPHCDEQFVIGELLTSVFGTWSIIDDPALPHGTEEELRLAPDPAGEEAEQTAAPKAVAAYSGTRRGGRLSRRRGKVNPNTDWSKFEPITYEEFERLRRQDGSPVRTIVQIALGGLLAIPISLLLIWHLLGTDVLNAGPFVGRYAPWIVPMRFRPAGDEQKIADGAPLPPAAGESGFRNFDEELAHGRVGPPTHDPSGAAAEADISGLGHSKAGAATLPTVVEPESDAGTQAPLNDATTSDATPAASSTRAPGDTAAGGQPLSPVSKSLPTAGVGAKEPPVTEPAQSASSAIAPPGADSSSAGAARGNAFDLIRQADKHLDQWKGSDEADDSRQLLGNTVYQDLLQLATSLNSYPKENPVLRTVREQMQPIGRAIKAEEALQQAVVRRSRQWLERSSGDRSIPLAMIVQIDQAVEEPEFWQITATSESQLSDVNGPLTITIPRVLAPSLMKGQRMMLLGMVSSKRPASSPAQVVGGPTPPPEDLPTDPAKGASAEVTDTAEIAPTPSAFLADYIHAL